MNLSVTFRHMEATDAIKDYAREKLDKIKRYFPDPITAHVVLTTERGYQHLADVVITLHNGIVLKGKESTEDMYSSIDLVMAKIERQVRRYKEKIRIHKGDAELSDIPVAYSVVAASELEVEPEAEVAPAVRRPNVVRTDEFPARPFTVEEAVMQMNLLGNTFFVFRNRLSGQVNVVYKRDDGDYGLIETGPAAG